MNIKTLLRAIAKSRPDRSRRKKTRTARPRDVADVAVLQGYRPRYWGPRGLETATLHKIDVSPVNGAVVAYYDTGNHRFLFRVVDGVPREIRRYEKGRR